MKPPPFPSFHFHSTLSPSSSSSWFKFGILFEIFADVKISNAFDAKISNKKWHLKHTKKVRRTIELNHTHTYAHIHTHNLYTLSTGLQSNRKPMVSHFFTAFFSFDFSFCAQLQCISGGFFAQKMLSIYRKKEWEPNLNHTRPIFIWVFYAPLFLFMKKWNISIENMFKLIAQRKKVKKRHSHRSGERELRTSEKMDWK